MAIVACGFGFGGVGTSRIVGSKDRNAPAPLAPVALVATAVIGSGVAISGSGAGDVIGFSMSSPIWGWVGKWNEGVGGACME